MQDYIHLTPSEVAYLITEGSILQKEHLYFTFMDLLLKRVIEVPNGFMVTPDPNINFELETFISIGPNFSRYSPLPHECIFTNIFLENNSMRTTILNHLIFAFKEKGFLESTNNVIGGYEDLAQYHKRPKLFGLIKSYKLNGKGLILSRKLEESLNQFDYMVQSYCTEEEVWKAIEVLDTKILLINGLNYRMFFDWCQKYNKSELPFTYPDLTQDKLSETQFNNIRAIAENFDYFYKKMMEAIHDENDLDLVGLLGI